MKLQNSQDNSIKRQPKPKYVQWLYMDRSCFHCTHSDTQGQKSPHEEMKTIDIMKALDSLYDLGCEVFYVTGGEPLLREDLFKVLGYAKEKGMKIVLTTSGYDADSFLQQIEDVGIDSIMICINGHKTYHGQIKGQQGSYERYLKTIRSFYEIDIPLVAVSMVIMDGNVMDIPKIIEEVYTYGENQLRFQPLINNNIEKMITRPLKMPLCSLLRQEKRDLILRLAKHLAIWEIWNLWSVHLSFIAGADGTLLPLCPMAMSWGVRLSEGICILKETSEKMT